MTSGKWGLLARLHAVTPLFFGMISDIWKQRTTGRTGISYHLSKRSSQNVSVMEAGTCIGWKMQLRTVSTKPHCRKWTVLPTDRQVWAAT